MKTIDNEQVEKLLEDIASIKEVINRNEPVIQQVINLAHFRLLSLLAGICISFFSFLFYALINIYGTHSEIPSTFKWIIYTAIFIITVVITVMKQRLYLSSLKKIDSTLTLSWWFGELFSNRFVHIYLSSIFLNIFLIFFFIHKGIPYFIIPSIALWIGLFGIAGTMLYIKHSLVMGYWFFITGIGLIIINTMPVTIAVFISFGIGFILLGLLGYIDQKSRKVDETGARVK